MALVVLDAHVLAGAHEGDRDSANLLTWLAYRGGDSAVDELAKVGRLVDEALVGGGGPSLAPLTAAAERSLNEMHRRLSELPRNYGLVTSGGLLDGMCMILGKGRAVTWINPSEARRLVGACATSFSSEEDLACLRKEAARRYTARMEAALADGARYVVVRSHDDPDVVSPPAVRSVARSVERVPLIGRNVAGRLKAMSPPPPLPQPPSGTDELLVHWNGHAVRTVTIEEFLALDDVPDLSRLDGTLHLVKKLYG